MIIHACESHIELNGLEATPRTVILRETGEPRSFVADFPYPVVPVSGHLGRFWLSVGCDSCRWDLEPDFSDLALADALRSDSGLDREE